MTIHKSITTERVMEACDRQTFGLDNPGFCLECGEETDECEPDAREYPCEFCGESKVYGAQEILIMTVA